MRAGLAALALTIAPAAAQAGGGPGDPDSVQEQGTHFLGEVKDVKGLAPLEGARVKIAIAGTRLFLVVLTDEQGQFRLEGFGRDVSADKVEVTCGKKGYRMIEALRHHVSGGKDSPIMVECLMGRDGA